MDSIETKSEVNNSENINNEDNNILGQKDKSINSLNTFNRYQIKLNYYQSDEFNHLNQGQRCNCQNDHHKHIGNIGNNYIFHKKYVFGPLIHIFFWIFCHIGNVIGWLIWLYAAGDFYPKQLYYVLDILCIIVEYYLTMSYITEPGIIPRKCPEYAIKEMELNENTDEKNKEEKNKEEIPSIYLERRCDTCQIMRPPGASHCRVCDNCVMGFDHHCLFISNCVGKRNRKYFVLFLFYGGIFAIICTCLVIRIMFYVFITKYDETLLVIWKNNPFLFILSIILCLLCLLFIFNPFKFLCQLLCSSITGYVLFWTIWFKNIERGKAPSYYTPLLFIAFGIALGLTLFIVSNFVAQIYEISRKLTIKQDFAIKDKLKENELNNRSNEALNEYIKKFSLKEKIFNLFEFIFEKIDDSLIIPERDLVENSS